MTKDEVLNFLKEKKDELKDKFDIEEIGLFGSYSRGDYNKKSDIDIVYVLKEVNKFGFSEYLRLEELLSMQFKKKIELINYKYMNPIIKHNAKKEIIYV
ncbi:MAG: nucleotidyltransferase domain-containing protein [Candidatus Aminicenantes bacterium]|nr:nucleotidyltransferase domain-containing protein [Candidatus Aminicenantes bacterium]